MFRKPAIGGVDRFEKLTTPLGRRDVDQPLRSRARRRRFRFIDHHSLALRRWVGATGPGRRQTCHGMTARSDVLDRVPGHILATGDDAPAR